MSILRFPKDLFLIILSKIKVAKTVRYLQSATWSNTNWSITGIYNSGPLDFEADPKLTANFSLDNDIAAEST